MKCNKEIGNTITNHAHGCDGDPDDDVDDY
jgi:hypothetical protein